MTEFDLSKTEKVKWAFRFVWDGIKLWKIDLDTHKEALMKDWWKGMWGSYNFYLENANSWISIKNRMDKLDFWVKWVENDNKNNSRHFQVIIEKKPEVKIMIGDRDEMVRNGYKGWKKKFFGN